MNIYTIALGHPNALVGTFMVGKFIVEESVIEKSGVEAWGWKIRGWNVLQLCKKAWKQILKCFMEMVMIHQWNSGGGEMKFGK